jgi:hypothetical protein
VFYSVFYKLMPKRKHNRKGRKGLKKVPYGKVTPLPVPNSDFAPMIPR